MNFTTCVCILLVLMNFVFFGTANFLALEISRNTSILHMRHAYFKHFCELVALVGIVAMLSSRGSISPLLFWQVSMLGWVELFTIRG